MGGEERGMGWGGGEVAGSSASETANSLSKLAILCSPLRALYFFAEAA